MLKKALYIVIITTGVVMCLLTSCQKEERYGSDLGRLEFSCDTIAFDTVFVQMGTTTRQFKVYNRGNEAVMLDEVTLAGGYGSRFRLNVDGDTHMVARDVAIAPGDSIFVFVRANIKPNLSTEPFLIEDAVLFKSSESSRRLPLTAYGRNAVYHIPTDTIHYSDGTYLIDQFGKPYAYSVIDCENWRHDLPHVIMGYAVVDSRQKLQLQAGDELYFCEDAVLWVYDSATLEVRGAEERPVLFTSVRHDDYYGQLPGQWGFVWLSVGSFDNVIDHAVIENGYAGIVADSCANQNPTLRISNTQIYNHSLVGLLGQTAYIVGDNLLVANGGMGTVALQYGGWSQFTGCTFADYWRYDSRKLPSVQLSNYMDVGGVHYVWPMYAQMSDCIIYGGLQNELLVWLDSTATVSATFDHCLVKGGEWDEDPKFVDPYEGDYHLEEDSPAIGIGYQYPESDTVSRTPLLVKPYRAAGGPAPFANRPRLPRKK